MKLRRLTALAAAMLMIQCSASAAFAENEPPPEADDPSSAVVTEAPADESSVASSSETEISSEPDTSKDTTKETTQEVTKETTAEVTKATTAETTAETTKETTVVTAEESQPDPSAQPSKIALEVGEIIDRNFEVKLNVKPETRITGATLKVEYDSTVVTLMSSKINSEAIGGMPVEKKTDGVYTFTYLNTEGTFYSGTYSTLNFKLADDTVASSVIYVTVEKLEDMNLNDAPNIIQNGIVRIRDDEIVSDDPADSASKQEDELPVIRAKLDPLPVTLEDLGVPDVINVKAVKLLDTQLAYYEKGAVFLLQTGETELVVKYINGNELRFKFIITEDKKADASSAAPSESSTEESGSNSARNLCIAAAVMFAIAAIALEYMFIMKPFRKRAVKEEAPAEDEFVAYDDDDETELVQDPEEVFAKRKRPAEDTGSFKKTKGTRHTAEKTLSPKRQGSSGNNKRPPRK